MASIAASPAFVESLKKRRFHSTPDTYENAYKKRCRIPKFFADGSEEDARDVHKYSQKQVDYMESVRLAEFSRIRMEYENLLVRKDAEISHLKPEIQKLQSQAQIREKEMERYQQENKILKRAINIQNNQKEECQSENKMLRQLATQAAEHIKRLEHTNYALRLHMERSNTTISDYEQSRDVY